MALARKDARKSTDDFGSVYRGHEGQWSWLLHRVTGVGIILFLFAHVVDTAVVMWGPEAYNRVMDAYQNPLVHLLELGLVTCVIYHSINGVKITLIDFFPSLAARVRVVGIVTIGVFVAAMIPVLLIMGRQTWHLLTG